MRRVIIIFMLFLVQGLVKVEGQNAMRPASRQQHDSNAARHFDEAAWKEVVGDTDYTEQEQEVDFQPPSMPWAGPVLKIIAYAVIIGLILWIFYYLVTNIRFGAGIQRTTIENEGADGRIENIESFDIETLLAQALRERNFRLVIRLYYLGILKKLHAREVIGWKKNKTNRDYLSELFVKDFHYREMQQLTVLYEAVWYGEHMPAAESFERLTGQFETMYQKINALKS